MSTADNLTSLIIPMQEHRLPFWEERCEPTIRKMGELSPIELIVVEGEGSAPEKRNKGAKQANGNFLLFADDDLAFPAGWLQKCIKKIGKHDFAYTDYLAKVADKAYHPYGDHKHKARSFSKKKLLQRNYIATTSLIRSNSFPGWDESIKRYQDWDLFLNIVLNGGTGIYVRNNPFIAYYNDEGISSVKTDANTHKKIIREKWGI